MVFSWRDLPIYRLLSMVLELWHSVVLKIFLKLALVGQLVTLHLRACVKNIYLYFLIEALPMLSLVISDSESRCDLPATNATENAISAVTKICLHLENQVPLQTVLPVWLSWLPVYEDKEEAPHIYSYLCKQIEKYVSRYFIPLHTAVNFGKRKILVNLRKLPIF